MGTSIILIDKLEKYSFVGIKLFNLLTFGHPFYYDYLIININHTYKMYKRVKRAMGTKRVVKHKKSCNE